MAFFKGLKRAFGFSENGEEPDDELDGVDGVAGARSPYVNPFKNDASEQVVKKPAIASTAMPKGHTIVHSNTGNSSSSQSATTSQLPPALIDDITSVLSSHLSNISQDAGPLKEKLADSEAQRRALQARANNMSTRIANLEGDVEQLELEKKSLLNKLKVAQLQSSGDSTQATAEVENITQEFKSKMEITNALLNDIRADAARKAKEIEELKAQLESGNSESAVLDAKNEEIAQLKKEKESDAALKNEEIARLKGQLEEANENLKVAAEIEEQLSKVEVFKDKKNKEVAAVRTEKEEIQGKLNQANEQIKKLKKQIEDLNKSAEEVSERRNRRDVNVANHIDDLKKQIQTAKRETSEQKLKVEELGKNVESLETQLEQVTSERDSLRKSHQDAGAKQQELADQVRANDSLLQSKEKDIEQQHQQLEDQRRQIAEKDKQIDKQIEQIIALEEQLEAAKNELVAAKSQPKATPVVEKVAEVKPAPVVKEAPEPVLEEKPEPVAPVEPVFTPAEPAAPADEFIPEDDLDLTTIDDDLFEGVEYALPKNSYKANQSKKKKEKATDAPVKPEVKVEPVVEEKPAPVKEEVAEAPKPATDSPFDDLDDLDWLVSTPPKKPEPEPEPEPEPVRKPVPPQQMSLF